MEVPGVQGANPKADERRARPAGSRLIVRIRLRDTLLHPLRSHRGRKLLQAMLDEEEDRIMAEIARHLLDQFLYGTPPPWFIPEAGYDWPLAPKDYRV